MVNTWPIAATVGAILGFLGGMGVGGGSLLILWLTSVCSLSYPTARVFNLLFFIPCALIASLFRWKQGTLDLKKLLPAILGGCIAAGVFSYIGALIDVKYIQKLFGILLLITGIREVNYKKEQRG